MLRLLLAENDMRLLRCHMSRTEKT